MGMFDELRCRYPLPIVGANDLLFQTKDTERQLLDLYEIREDGTLWHESYDTEDHSDPKAKGLARLCGIAARVNPRWEQEFMTGEIRFYTSLLVDEDKSEWIEFSAYFVKGQLKYLQTIRDVNG